MGAIAAEIGSPGVELREEGGVFRHRVFLPGEGAGQVCRRIGRLWRERGGPSGARLRNFGELERDWGLEGRRAFRGTRVGPFWIGPPWVEPPRERVAVRINPGRAFGTGLHPTTRVALRLLAGALGERLPPPRSSAGGRPSNAGRVRKAASGAPAPAAAPPLPPDRPSVLDLGVGSGVLALAALALGAARATGLDLDPEALANAAENRTLNAAGGRLRLAAGSLDALSPGRTFDLVLANLEHRILAPLLPNLARVVAPLGGLAVSGIAASARRDFLAAARRAGFRCRRSLTEGGWWGALLEPRRSGRRPGRRPGAPAGGR